MNLGFLSPELDEGAFEFDEGPFVRFRAEAQGLILTSVDGFG